MRLNYQGSGTLVLSTLLTGIGASGCAADRTGMDAVLDSAGVRITIAPATDRPAPWTVVSRRRIGAGAESDPGLLVEAPWGIAVDRAGRLLLYDEGGERVLILDTLGNSLGTLGRKGGGPGEYQFPGLIRVEDDGSVLVLDHGKAALVGFQPDGSPLPERSFRHIGYPFGGLVFVGDTAVFIDRLLVEGTWVEVLRWVTPEGSVALDERTNESLGEATFHCGRSRWTIRGMPLMLSPSFDWTVSGSRVAVSNSATYEVRVHASGELVDIIRRPVPPESATISHVRRLHPGGAIRGNRECVVPAEALVEAQGLAPVLPAVDGLRFAPDGSLWVRRFAMPGEPVLVDVFSPTAAYQGTLTGIGLPVGFLPGGSLIVLVPDPDTGWHQVVHILLDPSPW